MKRSHDVAMQVDNDPDELDNGLFSRSPLLRNELLRRIGHYVPSKSLVQMHRTCRMFHEILNAPSFIESYIAARNVSDEPIRTLGQLEMVQRMERHSLLNENRIGFEFASLEISGDVRSEEFDDGAAHVEGSQSRLAQFQAIAADFSESTIIIEAHCGRAAPRRVAPTFSQERGRTVAEQFQHLENVITVHSWGRNIADVAQHFDHPFAELAGTGKGWVEIYLQLDGETYPPRPPFYDGVALAIDPDDSDASVTSTHP